MKNLLFLIVMICIFTKALKGQVRYLDSIFSANEVKYNIEYGKNKIITTTKVLYMDVYSPQNDKEKNRPLVIIINDTSIGTIDSYSLVGSKSDFHLVYLAKKLTSMGYVVAVMDYRTGFFPGPWMGVNFKHMVTDSYKAVQDIKTCVRYFKKNSTLYDIDPQKIMLWGDDTGCMLALSSAFVNSTAEWFNTPKTILTIIDTTEIGNVDGTSYGIRRIYNPSTPTILVGDTLSLSNHEGFDSRVHLVVGMGQGILDTNWIDKDDCPVITFQNKLNTIKRYDDCFGYSIPVISNPLSQCGNFVTQKRANILKINKVFLGLQFKNDFSEVANSRNEGIEGIFPFIKK